MKFRETILRIYRSKMSPNQKQINEFQKSLISNDVSNIKTSRDSNVTFDTDIDMEYINNTVNPKYRDIINSFSDVLKRNFEQKDLKNYYHNINSFHINSFTENLLNSFYLDFVGGSYSLANNTISVNFRFLISNIKMVLYHELFHLASSKNLGNIKYSGFLFKDKEKKQSVGLGLNEGYTELLAARYILHNNSSLLANMLESLRKEIIIILFGEKNFQKYFVFPKYKHDYHYHVFIAEKLEQIVGKEKMQSLYLNANLKDLIDELKQYVNEAEINQFINNLDFLIYLQYHGKNKYPSDTLKNIDSFLIKCYSEKLKRMSSDIEASIDETNPTLTQYISELRMNRHKYEILPMNFFSKNSSPSKEEER